MCAASLGSARSWSTSAERTSCPVTRATPRRSAASRCQMSRARCVAAGRSTVRRVRWVRRSLADPSGDRKDWPPIRGARGCRKPVRRSVAVESSLGPMWLGLKFTAAIVPSWVPISKSVRRFMGVSTDSLTNVTLNRIPSCKRCWPAQGGCGSDAVSDRRLTAAILCNVAGQNQMSVVHLSLNTI
jgi:hypothetical protein